MPLVEIFSNQFQKCFINICLDWILSNFNFLLKQLIFRVFSFKGFTLSSLSSLRSNDDKHVSTIRGNCFKMVGESLELANT